MKRLRDIFIIFIFVLIIVGAYNTLKFFGFNFNNNTFIDYVSNDFNYIKTPTKDVNRNNIKFYDIINYEYKKIAFNKAKPTIPKEVEVIKNTKDTKEPIVYIYNTHQKEEYTAEKNGPYNITPTVYMAANILKENLRENGINAIVEDSSLQKGLSERGLNYNGAYTLSYEWLTSAKERYPSVKYFIDLHRDSVSSSTTINNYSYAKMMFVIGMNHDNYKKNEELMLKLNEFLNRGYEGLMREPFYGKNSRYNQHFNENVMLIEIGGPESTISEVSLSVKAFAESLSNLLGEDYGR